MNNLTKKCLSHIFIIFFLSGTFFPYSDTDPLSEEKKNWIKTRGNINYIMIALINMMMKKKSRRELKKKNNRQWENYTKLFFFSFFFLFFENPGRCVLFLVTAAWRIRNWQSSTACICDIYPILSFFRLVVVVTVIIFDDWCDVPLFLTWSWRFLWMI